MSRGLTPLSERGSNVAFWCIVASIPLLIIVGIWVAAFAPCSALGWVPLREAPLRCLNAGFSR